MDYNGDAISDQEWTVADMENLERMIDAGDEEEEDRLDSIFGED